MKAVFLAAGKGSRMRPLTHTQPKGMLPIANKPILEHLLIEAREAGIHEFILVIGYWGDQVRRYFGDGERWGVNVTYCEQKKQLGTADAIRMTESMLDGNFLVMNGDIIVGREDISRLISNVGNCLSLIEVEDPSGLGMVVVNGHRVVCIYEKIEKSSIQLANAGIYLFTPHIFAAISRTKKSARSEYDITDSLHLLMQAGQDVFYQKMKHWIGLSYPWDLLSANESLLTRIEPQNLGVLEENVVTKGMVSIAKGTVIRSGSYIVGPVIIGEGCEIGPNCYIRPHTAIGDGCHIGAAVEVKNSIIMKASKLPHHNYVGDSIIGEQCNLGAGTKIANLRLDKKNIKAAGVDTGRHKLGAIIGHRVETGINVSINVGCVIGNNSYIGPGAFVSGIVLPDSKIL